MFQVISFQFASVVMIASGTGITPMIQIIQEILENEDDMTFISLVYSIQSVGDIIYKDQLHEWSSFWNFNVQYCLIRVRFCETVLTVMIH